MEIDGRGNPKSMAQVILEHVGQGSSSVRSVLQKPGVETPGEDPASPPPGAVPSLGEADLNSLEGMGEGFHGGNLHEQVEVVSLKGPGDQSKAGLFSFLLEDPEGMEERFPVSQGGKPSFEGKGDVVGGPSRRGESSPVGRALSPVLSLGPGPGPGPAPVRMIPFLPAVPGRGGPFLRKKSPLAKLFHTVPSFSVQPYPRDGYDIENAVYCQEGFSKKSEFRHPLKRALIRLGGSFLLNR